MKKLMIIPALLLFGVLSTGCSTVQNLVRDEALPAMSAAQRADLRDAAGKFIEVYDENYNLDGTPKVTEPEAPAEEPVE